MKLIYFAPYRWWESCGSPKKVGGADVLFIDPDRYRRNKRQQQPTDSENFVTYKFNDLDECTRGISSRRVYEDYLLMEDKILDRIDDGEDLILLTDRFRYDNEVEFFRCLKKKKLFRLHMIISISAHCFEEDYHQFLRLINAKDICESICFINLYVCGDEDSVNSLLFNNQTALDWMRNAIEALPLRNTDGFCIYNNQKQEYVPCNYPEYGGNDPMEYKTHNGDFCEQMFRYRQAFAEKHGLDFKYNPCVECECKKECTDVCGYCDSRAERLWEQVYNESYVYENLHANINGIDRFRIGTDGNGVRSLILMAGCPLNCAYCGTKAYKDIFPETSDETVSFMELRLAKDGIYFEMTNGGVTFGGGEPLMQAEFIHEFHRRFPMWNINIETSLNVPADKLRIIAGDVDYWFVDIKDMNPKIYERYTGKSNEQVHENLAELLRFVPAEKICVRVPLIKGYNTPKDVTKSVTELAKMGFTNIERFEYIIYR